MLVLLLWNEQRVVYSNNNIEQLMRRVLPKCCSDEKEVCVLVVDSVLFSRESFNLNSSSGAYTHMLASS